MSAAETSRKDQQKGGKYIFWGRVAVFLETVKLLASRSVRAYLAEVSAASRFPQNLVRVLAEPSVHALKKVSTRCLAYIYPPPKYSSILRLTSHDPDSSETWSTRRPSHYLPTPSRSRTPSRSLSGSTIPSPCVPSHTRCMSVPHHPSLALSSFPHVELPLSCTDIYTSYVTTGTFRAAE